MGHKAGIHRQPIQCSISYSHKFLIDWSGWRPSHEHDGRPSQLWTIVSTESSGPLSHMAILSSPFQHWVAHSYCSDFVTILEKEKATWSRYASYSLTFPLPATLDLWRTVKKFWENKRDHLNKRDGPENFMEKNLCLCTRDVRYESTTDSLHWLERS